MFNSVDKLQNSNHDPYFEKLEEIEKINFNDHFEVIELDPPQSLVTRIKEDVIGTLDTIKSSVKSAFETTKLITKNCAYLLQNEVNGWINISEESRFHLAMFFAEVNPEYLSQNIQKFRILNPIQLLEIANVAAGKDGIAVSKNISNFNIKDQNHLFQIASKAAAFQGVTKYIKNFGITDEDHLFQIAKIALVHDGYFIQDVHLMQIQNKSNFFELAKITLKKYPELARSYTLYNLKKNNVIINELVKISESNNLNLDPKNDTDLVRLAELMLIRIDAFQNFDLSEENKIELILMCCEKEPDCIRDIIDYFCYNSDYHTGKLPSYTPNIEIKKWNYALKGLELMRFPAISKEKEPFHITEYVILLMGGTSWKLEYDKLPYLDLAYDKVSSKELSLNRWIGFYIQFCQFRISFKNEDLGSFLEHQKRIDASSLLLAIMKLRLPKKRFQLTRFMFQYLYNNKDTIKVYEYLNYYLSKLSSNKNLSLFKLLLTPLINAQIKKNEVKEYQSSIISFINYPYNEKIKENVINDWEHVFTTLSSSPYKDAAAQKLVVNALFSLVEEASELTMFEKSKLILAIFKLGKKIENKKDRAKCINQNLSLLEGIVLCGKSEKLKNVLIEIDKNIFHKDVLKNCLLTMFNLEIGNINVEGLAEKILASFLKSRQPCAFFTYASKLQSLPNSKSPLTPFVRIFYKSVLNGNYRAMRYSNVAGDHLSKVFSWNSEIKNKWIQCIKMPIEKLTFETESKEQVEKSFNVKQYFYERMNENHFDPKIFSKLDRCVGTDLLIEAIVNKQSYFEKQVLQNILEDLIEEEKKLLKDKGENDSSLQYLKLEIALISLMDPKKDIREKEGYIKTAINLLEKMGNRHEQALRDIKDLSKLLVGMNISLPGFMVEETDSWEDILLCGTEVLGSCQNINGLPEYNKCLLNYLLDGKNRLVSIKNAEGKTIARAILRLLWDDVSKKPVLFRECIYKSAGISDSILNSLDEMCKVKAKILGINLVKEKGMDSKGQLYPNPLKSLNGRAPFEYVDNGRLGITNGVFSIPSSNTEIIFSV